MIWGREGVIRKLSQAHIDIHLAVLLFGFSGLFGKWVTVSPIWVVAGRSFVAVCTVFLFMRLYRDKREGSTVQRSFINGLTSQHRWEIFASSLVLTLHWLTFYHAIQLSTVALGLIGFATYPIFVTLLEPWLTRQRYRSSDIQSALIVVMGLLVLSPQWDVSPAHAQGLFWAVVSGALNAIFTLMNRRLVREVGSADLVFMQQVFVTLVLLPFVFLTMSPANTESLGHTLWMLLVLGLVFTAVPQSLYARSLIQLKAQFVSIVTCLEPVYSIFLAAVLLGEVPDGRTLLGAVLILFAVLLSIRAHSYSSNEDTA